MLNKYLTFYKPAIQFVVFCAILSMSWLLGGNLIELLNVKMTGYSALEITNMKEIPAHLSNSLKFINSILLIIILLLPASIFAYLAYPSPTKYLGIVSNIKGRHWLFAILILILAIPFSSLIEQWSQWIPFIAKYKDFDHEYDKMAESMLQGNTIRDLFINTIAICLLPAIIEEIFFRGCMQQILVSWMRKTPFLAILTVAIVFSAFHGQVGGFLPRVFLGLMLGLSYYYSGSILVTITMHFLNNFVTVFLVYLYHAKMISIDINKVPDINILAGLACGLALGIILYYFYRDRISFQIFEIEKEEINNEENLN